MRLSTALKLVAVLIAALAVGLVAAAKSMDFQRIKGVLSEQVLAATGRQLTIAGPLELRLGLVPRIIASGITLGNMPGGSRPEMAKIDRVEAEVALLPLLKREIRIQRLVVTAPDVLLETGRDGKGNWLFPAIRPETQPPVPAGKNGIPATRFTLREVKIKAGRVVYRDGRDGSTRTINLHRVQALPDAIDGGRLTLHLDGDVDSRVVTLDGRLGMAAGKPWVLALQGAFDGVQAKAEGSVADPLAARGIDLSVVMQGDELGKLARGAGLAGNGTPPALGPFKLAARLSDSGGVLALNDLELSAGRRDALLLTGRGNVRDVVALGGFELALAVESDTLAGLSRLTGTEVPPIGPLKLTGTLGGELQHLKLSDIKATLAGSDASGEAALDLSGRPRLTAAFSSNLLALADFTTPASKPGEKLAPKALKADGDGRLFPAGPLGLNWLRDLDAQVALRAHRIDVASVRLSEAAADVTLTGGRLAVRPFKAWAAGGPIEGEALLDVAGSDPALNMHASARGVELGRLLKEAGSDALTGGRTDARLDLRGHGGSWRALMASASGEAVVSVGEGKLHNTSLDWAGGDLLIQLVGVLNPLSRSEDSTPLSCAAARFVAKDGIATADRGIAVETAKVNVVGAGTVDLRDERLDLGITPRARDGIGVSLSAPLAGMTRVRGTLANPSLSLDELGAARTAASVGAAVATGGLSLLGEAVFDRITADSTPCKTALGNAAASKPAAKSADKKKPGKAAKSGGFLGGLFGN